MALGEVPTNNLECHARTYFQPSWQIGSDLATTGGITGWTMVMRIAAESSGTAITSVNATIIDSPNRRFRVILPISITSTTGSPGPGSYYYHIFRTDSSQEMVLSKGDLVILPTITTS
jgi:hypothetical protein